MESLQYVADTTRPSQYSPLPLLGHLQWPSQRNPGFLTNVIGVLPGHLPRLRNEIILLGAHRDHFREQAGLFFSGADDNASGTAVMLEIIRVLTTDNHKSNRTIFFVSFDGEERGLLGSRQYVKESPHLKQIKAMINLDHVGIGNGKLTVGITRLDKSLAQQAAQQTGLTDQIRFYGYFRGGDHIPFFDRGLPTITIVSNGVHPHFHQPSDTPETLQPSILDKAAQYTLGLLKKLDDQIRLSPEPSISVQAPK